MGFFFFFFLRGNQGDASFQVGLQKYVVATPLSNKVYNK